MAAASWFRYVYLTYAARPKSARQLYRLVKRERVCRIVEVGVSDIRRTIALIEVAQRAAGQRPVFYTAIDWFDTRTDELAPLKLKETYRTLRATGATVRLAPGAPGRSLAAVANAHQNTDLMLIGPMIADSEMESAWFYVPRMLHERTLILRQQCDSLGQPAFTRITFSQVAEWAGRHHARRAA